MNYLRVCSFRLCVIDSFPGSTFIFQCLQRIYRFPDCFNRSQLLVYYIFHFLPFHTAQPMWWEHQRKIPIRPPHVSINQSDNRSLFFPAPTFVSKRLYTRQWLIPFSRLVTSWDIKRHHEAPQIHRQSYNSKPLYSIFFYSQLTVLLLQIFIYF